jgi:hypothetical protein
MTTSERWVWHTETYAWRIAHGYGRFDDIATGKYSPTDPTGEYWDEAAVRLRVRLMLDDREDANRGEHRRKDELAVQGRRMLNAWAVKHGYIDWNAAWEAKMKPGTKEGFLTQVAAEVQQMFPNGRKPLPRGRGGIAADLGVRAEPASIPVPEGEAAYLQSVLAKRLGKETGEAAE